jgi:GH25 family lysozyme M1 (1,4-beta-N-acetylmuramidase)
MVGVRLVVLLASFFTAYATLGVDVSDYVDTFTCLRNSGYDFAIVRGYQSMGRVDPNAVSNIKNAHSAGFMYVDVYAFPCVSCGNPSGQANSLVSSLGSSSYGTIWLDVETYAWPSSQSSNQQFILSWVNTLKSHGRAVGIYSSYYNWQDIVGLSWTGCSSLPLWYAHYDNSQSFSDFQSFGGWSRPAMKQYAGDKTVCGADVDLNYY